LLLPNLSRYKPAWPRRYPPRSLPQYCGTGATARLSRATEAREALKPTNVHATTIKVRGLWLLKCPLSPWPKCPSFPDIESESNSISDFLVKRSLPHRDGLLRTEGHTFQAARALRSEHRKNDPVLGWHARLPWHTGIGSEHLLRASIQAQPAVQRIAASLCIDFYLHCHLDHYQGNLVKLALGFRVIASLSQTARQTPQP